MKVWIYKGNILPYKLSEDARIDREAAMAVGDTSGEARPKRVVTAGGGKRRPEQGEPGAEDLDTPIVADAPDAPTDEAAPAPILGEADPELERILAEEEEINRRLREHHEAPHFHKDSD